MDGHQEASLVVAGIQGEDIPMLVVGMDTLGQCITVADIMGTMAEVAALEGLGWGWVGGYYWDTHWGG